MKTMLMAALCCLVTAFAPAIAWAAAEPGPAGQAALTPEQEARLAKIKDVLTTIKPAFGVVELPAANAKLNLGDKYYYLNAADSARVLVDGWGNPPGSEQGVLGMVFPAGKSFVDDDVWGAVITYEKTFYVSDEKARDQDYDKVLEELRAGQDESNRARTEAGYPTMTLVGWAQAPTYDPIRHDLIWARDFELGGDPEHALNYDVRHLGREGVLSMNLLASMSQLPQIREAAAEVAKTVEFNPGARYADYKEGDKLAGYGLAGLVAAGAGAAVAKKVGLLAILLLALKKGGVFIFVFVASGLAWLKSRLGGKPKRIGAALTEAGDGPTA